MTNRLQFENSPYLRQHQENPVEWYPWGDEAFAKARRERKPILLSIGYAACHWCHVMAHESFENAETAATMNRYFVNIKVDREERPDLDTIYMSAVQAMTGHGGWPMTVALTPQGEPFFGGTYFPPTPRYGMPSFKQVLMRLAGAWARDPDNITSQAKALSADLYRQLPLNQGSPLNANVLDYAMEHYRNRFDSNYGGFTQEGPKFPPSMSLEFLLRMAQQTNSAETLHLAEFTLQQMAYGGIYDQIGGGFARYAVDAIWLVPHFEKMLYDNAQLARVYLHAWQLTKKPLYRRIAEETLDWVLREMTHPDGGFYSSLDADSEGEEGKFYVWEKWEIDEILGEDAALFTRYYDVTDHGNWEGKNILTVAEEFDGDSAELTATLGRARQKLYAHRTQRVWPGLDDKVLTAWNGLMLAAFAEAGPILQRPDYTEAAIRNAQFLYDTLRDPNSWRLKRTWKADGSAKYNGYLEDYAYLAEGVLTLYQTTHDPRWYDWGKTLTDQLITHFRDVDGGGFFDTSNDHEKLLHRPKTVDDNATPSGNGMATRALLLMGFLSGENRYLDLAESILSALQPVVQQYPSAFGQSLGNLWLWLSGVKEVAIVGDSADAETKALIDLIWEQFRPNVVLAVGTDQIVPLLTNRPQIDGRSTAYVCQRFTCQTPVTTPDLLRQQLKN